MTTSSDTPLPTVTTELFFHFTEPWKSEHLSTARIDDHNHALPANHADVYPGELLEHYLTSKDFTCCMLNIGLEITIDGRSWTDHTADHLWYMWNWFEVLERARQNDQTKQPSFVWDQSHLVLERNGELLKMWDENTMHGQNSDNKTFAWNPVTIDFTDFYVQMQHRRNELFDLDDALIGAIKRQGYDLDTLLARLEGLGDRPRPADDDQELKCAIIAREIIDPAKS